MKTEAMNIKENKEAAYGRAWKVKWKEEIMWLYYDGKKSKWNNF